MFEWGEVYIIPRLLAVSHRRSDLNNLITFHIGGTYIRKARSNITEFKTSAIKMHVLNLSPTPYTSIPAF